MPTIAILPFGRVPRQKIAMLGDLRACIISPVTGASALESYHVFFWNPVTGQQKEWPLSGVSANSSEACCCLVGDANGAATALYVATRENNGAAPTTINVFDLPDNVFTEQPAWGSTLYSGDADSRRAEFVKLDNGYVAVVTVQHTDMMVYVHLCAPNGMWKSCGVFKISDDLGTSHEFTVCAIPWNNNSFIVFDMRDGGPGVDAAIFTIVSGLALVTSRFSGILNRSTINGKFVQGLITPDGEDPALTAVCDKAGNRILLSLTNDDQGNYPMINGLNQSHPMVVGIGPDMIPYLAIISNDLVIAVLNPIPIFVQPGGASMGWCITRSNGSLLCLPGINDPIPVNPGGFAFNPTPMEVVYSAPDGNGVFLLQGSGAPTVPPIPVPPPPPVPIPVPIPVPQPPASPVLVCNAMASFSWSWVDPSNTGKYMLQTAISTDGPWMDMTDHWQISIGARSLPVKINDNLWRVDDKFYRLNPKS